MEQCRFPDVITGRKSAVHLFLAHQRSPGLSDSWPAHRSGLQIYRLTPCQAAVNAQGNGLMPGNMAILQCKDNLKRFAHIHRSVHQASQGSLIHLHLRKVYLRLLHPLRTVQILPVRMPGIKRLRRLRKWKRNVLRYSHPWRKLPDSHRSLQAGMSHW